MPSQKSSVEDKGKIVTQIIHFKDGQKKTFHGVLTNTIEQSEFTRFDLKDSRRVYINTNNVNCFEVIEEMTREEFINRHGNLLMWPFNNE